MLEISLKRHVNGAAIIWVRHLMHAAHACSEQCSAARSLSVHIKCGQRATVLHGCMQRLYGQGEFAVSNRQS